MKKYTRWIVLAVLLSAVAAFVAFDLHRLFTLDNIKAQQAALEAYRGEHPLASSLAYFAAYVAMAGLSLPGAAILTLVGGAVFGVLWGTLLVSFASSIGATLAMLTARFLLREPVQRRFGDRLKAINEGMAREGAFYLFALRLVPVFPFFAVNLVMGLTPIRARTFYWVSQLGMLPATIVFVNAGTQLAQIESLDGILSPKLIASFALLGVFPVIARFALGRIRRRATRDLPEGTSQ